MRYYILPSFNWVGWKKTLPDILKEIANRTKKELKEQGYVVRQKYWKDYGWITYYAPKEKVCDLSVQYYFSK